MYTPTDCLITQHGNIISCNVSVLPNFVSSSHSKSSLHVRLRTVKSCGKIFVMVYIEVWKSQKTYLSQEKKISARKGNTGTSVQPGQPKSRKTPGHGTINWAGSKSRPEMGSGLGRNISCRKLPLPATERARNRNSPDHCLGQVSSLYFGMSNPIRFGS